MSGVSGKICILSHGTVVPSREPDWHAAIPASEKRKSPRIWQMASVAARRALTGTPDLVPAALVTGTALGALDETRTFLEKIFTENTGSPRNFIASVHNSMAGKIALELNIRGPNLTVCEGQNSFAAAVAAADLLDDSCFPVLIVAVDENIPLLDQLLPHLSPACRSNMQPGWADGAVAFVCARTGSGPTLRAAGPVPADTAAPAAAIETLAARFCADGAKIPAICAIGNGFPAPALSVAAALDTPASGTLLFPSFSPSTNATALVELCR